MKQLGKIFPIVGMILLTYRLGATNAQVSSPKSHSHILHLFERPSEPTFYPKGKGDIVYDLPKSHLLDKHSPELVLASRFGTKNRMKIPVKEIKIPSLDLSLRLARDTPFSTFIPAHRRMAAQLIDTFLGMPTFEDFMSVAAYARDRINPTMFNYALSVAILHRRDTRNLSIPPLHEVFPNQFVHSNILARAKRQTQILPSASRTPIVIPLNYTASDVDEEHHVAYFREDLGINLHHWQWHLVFPFEGNRSLVDKDRRGELFYYMHRQVIARYNTERLCNRMPLAEPLKLREPIPEAYFSKLDLAVASRSWPARPVNLRLKDVNRTSDLLQFRLQDLETWKSRIEECIRTRSVNNSNGQQTKLTDKDSIDMFGNMVEASILSPNNDFYGNLHNWGHVIIAVCHDPDHRYLEPFSIMGETATAMRDPVFYRWHTLMDNIFLSYKDTLPPYTVNELNFPSVKVVRIDVTTPRASADTILTFWNQSDVDLTNGTDFGPREPVLVRFTHLNHAAFKYSIVVNNQRTASQIGTCRIFAAARYDGSGGRFNFREQKNLMIELDRFKVDLKPGLNTITRKSSESNVTIPFERTFRNLTHNRADDEAFYECGCGWPQHMLVPKGTPEGFEMDLFVMISNYANDKVEEVQEASRCTTTTYCSVLHGKYPDARPMGYPFDRQPRKGVTYLKDFLTPNMGITGIKIKFRDSGV